MSNEQQQVEKSDVNSLMNLTPLEAEISLTLEGVERKFTLRKYNLGDTAWGQRKFGEKFDEVINNAGENLEAFSVLLYRLIKEKDQLRPKEVSGYDDDGKEIKIFKSGPDIVLDAMIGPGDLLRVYGSFLKTIGHSEALIDESTQPKSGKASPKKKQS